MTKQYKGKDVEILGPQDERGRVPIKNENGHYQLVQAKYLEPTKPDVKAWWCGTNSIQIRRTRDQHIDLITIPKSFFKELVAIMNKHGDLDSE